MNQVYGALWALLIVLISVLPLVRSIGCFVCSSINGTEPECEDVFNNTGRFYQPECKAGRRGRRGVFPATGCIKMKAYNDTYSVTVRDCTVDNGDTTSDTEMGRESHCWMVNMVRFNDVDMYGCALACHTDGCNRAPGDRRPSPVSLLLAATSSAALVVLAIVVGGSP